MTVSILKDALPGVFQAVFYGDVTIEERALALDHSVQWIRQDKPHRILLDFTEARVVAGSPEATIRHATNLAHEYNVVRGVRIAYVSRFSPQRSEAVELMAAARGYFYQRFTDRAFALDSLFVGETAPVATPPGFEYDETLESDAMR